MIDRVDSILGHLCHARREALGSAETIIANLCADTSTVWRWTSGAAYEIEEYGEHFDEDDAHTIVVRLYQDLNSYFYNLLSEDPYGVLQPENDDPDVQNRFRKIALAKAAPSVKDRIREAYKNRLGADAHERHSDDEDEED
ncbi:hypothetical protein BDV39DRAFT_205879 [Aspergillus sergii]|uniref:Uncharacterized protein n=1 Tax=Aspergillus sergii TaxID=1034303 RepID=A0A5N6X2W9_9EURO|nr:hypothetical protein BDV39DRAFT_205879 [Aspergillus sergii]